MFCVSTDVYLADSPASLRLADLAPMCSPVVQAFVPVVDRMTESDSGVPSIAHGICKKDGPLHPRNLT